MRFEIARAAATDRPLLVAVALALGLSIYLVEQPASTAGPGQSDCGQRQLSAVNAPSRTARNSGLDSRRQDAEPDCVEPDTCPSWRPAFDRSDYLGSLGELLARSHGG